MNRICLGWCAVERMRGYEFKCHHAGCCCCRLLSTARYGGSRRCCWCNATPRHTNDHDGCIRSISFAMLCPKYSQFEQSRIGDCVVIHFGGCLIDLLHTIVLQQPEWSRKNCYFLVRALASQQLLWPGGPLKAVVRPQATRESNNYFLTTLIVAALWYRACQLRNR